MLSEIKQSFTQTLLLLSCIDKKVPQRSSRPTLHSLINSSAQPETSELATICHPELVSGSINFVAQTTLVLLLFR